MFCMFYTALNQRIHPHTASQCGWMAARCFRNVIVNRKNCVGRAIIFIKFYQMNEDVFIFTFSTIKVKGSCKSEINRLKGMMLSDGVDGIYEGTLWKNIIYVYIWWELRENAGRLSIPRSMCAFLLINFIFRTNSVCQLSISSEFNHHH